MINVQLKECLVHNFYIYSYRFKIFYVKIFIRDNKILYLINCEKFKIMIF